MNPPAGSPVALFLLLPVVLAAAGCTGMDPADSPAVPPATVVPASAITVPPVLNKSHTTSPAGTATSPAHLPQTRIFGPYSWAGYRNNMTQTLAPNPRYQWEIDVKIRHSNESYNGMPALHEKVTETMDYSEWVDQKLIKTKNGQIRVTDRYFAVPSDAILGGTRAGTIKGTAQPGEDIRADEQYRRENQPSFSTGISPFGEMNITLTDLGTESVTVPAGYYPSARKYTGAFRNGVPITFWVVPDIPVPVRFCFPSPFLEGDDPVQTFELIGWG